MSVYLFLITVGIGSAWAGLELSKPNSALRKIAFLYPSVLPVPPVMLSDPEAWHDHYCKGTLPNGCPGAVPVTDMTEEDLIAEFSPEGYHNIKAQMNQYLRGAEDYTPYPVWKKVDLACCRGESTERYEYALGEFPQAYACVKPGASLYRRPPHTGLFNIYSVVSKHHCIAPFFKPLGVDTYTNGRAKFCTPDHYRVVLEPDPRWVKVEPNQVAIFDPLVYSYRPRTVYNVGAAIKRAFYVVPLWSYDASALALANAALGAPPPDTTTTDDPLDGIDPVVLHELTSLRRTMARLQASFSGLTTGAIAGGPPADIVDSVKRLPAVKLADLQKIVLGDSILSAVAELAADGQLGSTLSRQDIVDSVQHEAARVIEQMHVITEQEYDRREAARPVVNVDHEIREAVDEARATLGRLQETIDSVQTASSEFRQAWMARLGNVEASCAVSERANKSLDRTLLDTTKVVNELREQIHSIPDFTPKIAFLNDRFDKMPKGVDTERLDALDKKLTRVQTQVVGSQAMQAQVSQANALAADCKDRVTEIEGVSRKTRADLDSLRDKLKGFMPEVSTEFEKQIAIQEKRITETLAKVATKEDIGRYVPVSQFKRMVDEAILADRKAALQWSSAAGKTEHPRHSNCFGLVFGRLWDVHVRSTDWRYYCMQDLRPSESLIWLCDGKTLAAFDYFKAFNGDYQSLFSRGEFLNISTTNVNVRYAVDNDGRAIIRHQNNHISLDPLKVYEGYKNESISIHVLFSNEPYKSIAWF